MHNYCLEFILNIQSASLETVRNSIMELGEGLEISLVSGDNITQGRDFKIRIHTKDPTIVFDTCSQFGRLKSVKVDEERRK